MATTHALSADTRMEDLPGLASGDTIALGGHVLTCESNLSAITGLYATGTGTIRLLDGGNCDFSGSTPLPATVSIEGGTEDNPLPAHGDYGYPLRAAAALKLHESSTFAGRIVSHCLGNANRVQGAIVKTVSGSTVTLDRDMELEAGDAVLWAKENGNSSTFTVVSYSAANKTAVLSGGTLYDLTSDKYLGLATCGFCIYHKNNAAEFFFSGNISGDEIGIQTGRSSSVTGYVFTGNLDVGRIVVTPLRYCTDISPIRGATGRIGTLVAAGSIFRGVSGVCAIGCAVANAGGTAVIGNGAQMRVGGGILNGNLPINGRAEYVDCEVAGSLYTSIGRVAELVIRTTNGIFPTCVVHRAGGIATLVDRTDIEVPTSLPDAWRLDPIEDGTAWHDVPMTVLPGKTLSCIWYWMLGEEGATAGCQILDGEGPGWGSIAMNPGMVEVLAETAVPDGASPLRPFVAVPISWRNPGREIRKVVLRGWARGGTAYSRIDPAAGGLA